MGRFGILISLFIAAVFSSCAGRPAEDMTVSFYVSDPTADEVVLVYHNTASFFKLDESGHAEAVLKGMDAVYAKLFYGRDSKMIYLEDGDDVKISFEGRNFKETFSFEGDNSAAVEYLNSIILTPLPDETYALSFKEFMQKVTAKKNDAVKLLDAYGLKSSGNFEGIEKGRIAYSYGAMILMYPMGHAVMSGGENYVPAEEYYSVVEDYMVEDEELVDLDEYRAFVAEGAHVLDEENRDVKGLYPKTLAQMRYIADRYQSQKVRESLLHYLAAPYVDRFGTDDIQDLENIYKTYVKDELLLADYAAKREKWDLSKPGKVSPDFHAVDIDGKEWSLKDFKGKYVYIDLWATWCNPCRREFPFLKQLKTDFEGAEIVFLGLSTDGSKDKWEDMVRTGELSGVQLYLGPQSSFQKAYNVDGIPRFILLDKEGKIISNDMSRPSSQETRAFLESLEGIR